MSEYIRTIRLTAPASEPVSLAEAKENMRVDVSDEDSLITSLISVARDKAEKYCNRYFADATAALIFESLPTGETPLDIPVPDVQSVDAVTYIDDTGAPQVVSNTTFNSDVQLLYPESSWPTDEATGARVDVSVGAPVEIVAVKQAILLFVTDLYEHRGNMSERQIYNNQAATMLLQPYRVTMGI